MIAEAKFWDRIAPKYAKSPIRNMAAYEATMNSVRSRLSGDDRVLEIGCGTGSTALKLADAVAHITASDISGGMIDIARSKAREAGVGNVEFTVAPAVEARFERECFAAVLGFNILHLVEDLPAAVARAHEVLKPGGLYITKTPCLRQMNPLLRLVIPVMQFFGKAPFVALFKAPDLEALIRQAGFEIVEARAFDGAPNSWFVVAHKV